MNESCDSPLDVDKLVSTWIARYSLDNALDEDETDWAWDTLYTCCHDHPELAWQIIRRFLDYDLTPWVGSNLAAGPLEDFIAYHGEAYIDRIESLASASRKFNDLLWGVWQRRTPDHIWNRVLAARIDEDSEDGSPP